MNVTENGIAEAEAELNEKKRVEFENLLQEQSNISFIMIYNLKGLKEKLKEPRRSRILNKIKTLKK